MHPLSLKPEVHMSQDDAPKAEIARCLPGETERDEALLDQAVAEINRIYISKGLETARSIGRYVLEVFFGGNLAAFHQRNSKHETFRALASRTDLRVAYNTLWYSVAVLDQLRALPVPIAESLPFTHHKLLLPIQSPEAKTELAKKAVDEHLSSRDFASLVREARVKEIGPTRGGRPPLPAFVKGLSALSKAVAVATSEEISADFFERVSPSEVRRLIAEMEQQLSQLAELSDKLLAAADARDDRS